MPSQTMLSHVMPPSPEEEHP